MYALKQPHPSNNDYSLDVNISFSFLQYSLKTKTFISGKYFKKSFSYYNLFFKFYFTNLINIASKYFLFFNK